MLSLGLTCTISIALEPQDGPKGIDGLAGIVQGVLGRDPSSGDLFVFKNRRGTAIKILAWMGDGFALYHRRMKKEAFAFPTASSSELTITPTQLAMILGGVEQTRTRSRRRYHQPH